MLVITGFYRYRFLVFIFLFSLIATFLLKFIFSSSPKLMNFHGENYQQISASGFKKDTKFTSASSVQKTVLENGLTVLTKEVHSSPVVSVQVWYDVGSVYETPGINGIAHQLEHIMFKGTKSRPVQFSKLFSALGSDNNGFTSYEQTAYYHTAEKDKLSALLELEADRMENLLIDNQQLDSEKRVVISELKGYENNDKYRLRRALMRSVFPDSGYGLPTAGTVADVEKLTVEQVKAHYQQFYHPDHAILVVVGDFQTQATLERVKSVFGKIPKSGIPTTSVKSPTPHIPSSPVVLREPGAGKILQMIYPLPHLNDPDIPVLGVLDYILTGGKNAYLHENLIKSGLATNISARVVGLREVGWYDLSVDVADDQDLASVSNSVKSAIIKLGETGITLERLERAKKLLIANVVLNKRDITSQGMQFANDELIADDYEYTKKYLEKVRQVTTADVVNVINQYFKPELAAVGFFEPQQNVKVNSGSSAIVNDEVFTDEVNVAAVDVSQYLPKIDKNGNNLTVNLPLPQKLTFDNGLRVLLFADPSSPTVTLGGYIKAGKEFEQADKAGLAALVAENLMSGTRTKDTLTISKIVEDRGASLGFTALREGVRIQSQGLREDLPVLIETIADVVRNSTFPEQELGVSRQRALSLLKSDLADPYEVANRKFIQSLYPQSHPLHIFPTQESLGNIQREDVLTFWKEHYRPDRMVLVLVGDVDVEAVRSLVDAQFSDWRVKGKPPVVEYPQVVVKNKGVRINSVIPGKSQAVTYMGYVGIKRQDPRFYQALVLNQILGGDSLSSRLGAEVRDRLGLSYHIYSNFQGGRNVGTFLIEMQTNPEDANKAIATTRKLLEQIHNQGVTTTELETAKRSLISEYNISLSKPEQLNARILLNEVYGLDTLELRNFVQKIQKVTQKEVNQAARELLDPDKFVIVTAGPEIMTAHSK
ncbi:MAG: insulinase family protein [Nostocales cyanobacterium]|nr:MAG: insulinase family protein [Nostocales cyanobacterium]TAF07637.1 MAG: insulinase family protein [Nostocales cyanobacterium]